MQKSFYSTIVLLFIFLSIIFSFYIGEDSTGGARNDYLHHEKIIFLFADNFKDTFLKYGTPEVMARNSPVFYIVVSFLIKLGLNIKTINYLNIIILPLYIFIFLKCINIKYKFITLNEQFLFSSIILLSPTIRSLVVWPYPIIWALFFFLCSIYFFLKFDETNNSKQKLIYSLNNILFLALSAYITPNFAVFSIFYFIKYFNFFKNSKNLILIILFNLVLAFPAIFYYIKTDFYLFKYTVENVNTFTKYNLANKVVIIISIIFFYFIPFFEFKKIKNFNVKNFFHYKNYLIITILCLLLILFNFPSNLGVGGGVFFHLSNKIFGNSTILFLVFIFAVFAFKFNGMINSNNLILFFCLIFYNTQNSIYHKYFDPLIYFIILFLMELNENRKFKLNNILFSKIFVFYLFFLIISFFKKILIY